MTKHDGSPLLGTPNPQLGDTKSHRKLERYGGAGVAARDAGYRALRRAAARIWTVHDCRMCAFVGGLPLNCSNEVDDGRC